MIKVQIDQRALKRAEKILASVDDTVAIAAYDAGLKKAGDVVRKKASAMAPRGDRSRQTSKMQSRWDSRPLNKLIKTKVIGRGVRRGSKVPPSALIGAQHPYGNQINFIHPNATTSRGRSGSRTKKQVYWGKGGVTVRKQNDFLKRAFDTTRDEQVRAFVRGIVPEIRKNLGRKRG